MAGLPPLGCVGRRVLDAGQVGDAPHAVDFGGGDPGAARFYESAGDTENLRDRGGPLPRLGADSEGGGDESLKQPGQLKIGTYTAHAAHELGLLQPLHGVGEAGDPFGPQQQGDGGHLAWSAKYPLSLIHI